MVDGEAPSQSAHTISAVLADVDGTLVTNDKVLTERAIQAVNELRARGIVFTVCSSRSPRGLRMLVEPLRLAIPVKYGIKNIKRIGAIRLTDIRPADFWGERGYDWYAGH